MPIALAKPLSREEHQELAAIIMEMESRGVAVSDDLSMLMQPELKADARFRLGGNGYFLRNDGKQYKPTEQQEAFIKSPARFVLFRAGRGGGKSAAGSQKAMFKIMQGENGAVINPVFGDFKTSTWPEFKQWIDWSMVVPSQRHRKNDAWQPHQPFTMTFLNGATVYCKGLKDPKSARGANINWLWYDEAASDETGMSWKIAIASVRIGNMPQSWATTTPKGREHWVYKFFIEKDLPQEVIELLQKDDRILIETFRGSILDNKDNVDPGFYASIVSAFPSGWLRAQEVEGDFAEEGGKIGDRRWFDGKIIPAPPEYVKKRVRFWDLAATEKKQATDDPDEAVGTLMSKRYDADIKKDMFCIEHQVGGCWAWEQLLEAIVATARHDGIEVPIVLEEEPGSGGKNQVEAVKVHFKSIARSEIL